MYSKLIQFYTKNNYDNILKLSLLIINTISLLYFIETSWCLPITILLLSIYLIKSKIELKNKKSLVYIWIIFSLTTLLGESLVISSRDIPILKYKNPDINNVPLWLISAYLNMVISVIILYDYFSISNSISK
jgi:hypothetical protein